MPRTAIHYPRLLARLLNTSLLTTEARALTLLSVLGPRAGLRPETQIFASEDEEEGFSGPLLLKNLAAATPRLEGPRDERKVYRVVDGVAVIPAVGDLVNRLGTLDPWCGMTGYDGIAYKVDEADADPDVRGIALDVDSLGGEVLGVDACAQAIARAQKPIRAFLSQGYSAAYWLASQCDRVTVSTVGGAGSIGVVSLHADYSGQLSEEGIAITVLRAGLHKAEGDPFHPLPDDVKARFLKEMEDLRSIFANAVAKGRSLDVKDVLGTEALAYGAADSLALGLADAVMTPDDALAEFISDLDTPTAHPVVTPAARHQGVDMKTTTQAVKTAKKSAENPPAPDEDEDDQDEKPCAEEEATAKKPCADDEEGDSGDDDEEDGEAKAKARIKAILASDAGKKQPKLAQHLAFETSMGAKAAVAALEAAQEDAATPANAFEAAMSRNPGPELGAGKEKSSPKSDLATAVDRVMAKNGIKPTSL